jgi:transcriptional regulator with XRE-family HTH domain
MTPFGEKLRALRQQRGVTAKAMAAALGVSASYLSALEHGKRGAPTWLMVQRIITYFNIIWDDAEELQKLAARSHPRIVIDTAGLDAAATDLANRLAADISKLKPEALRDIAARIEAAAKRGA